MWSVRTDLSLLGIDSGTSPHFIPLDRSTRLASEFPYLALRFDGVEQSENMWPVNRMLTLIGRGVQCKLRLNHRSMGNIHAALLRTSTGCWVIDLVRDGSTSVNGRAIQVSPIDAGDELQFGEFRVEVVALGVPSVVSAATNAPEAKKFGISSDKSLPPIRFDRQPKESLTKTAYVAKPIVNRAPVHQVATIVPDTVAEEDPVHEMPAAANVATANFAAANVGSAEAGSKRAGHAIVSIGKSATSGTRSKKVFATISFATNISNGDGRIARGCPCGVGTGTRGLSYQETWADRSELDN